MALIATKCPNCAGEIQLDDKRSTGFCLYCGDQIDVKQAISSINVNISGTDEDVKNWQAAFDKYCSVFDYEKAEKMADKILQARPNDPDSLDRYNMVRDAKNLEISSSGVLDGFKDNNRTISEVSIPLGVRSIGNHAFEKCDRLKEVRIPESVTSIGFSALYGCMSLKEVRIPESVTRIGSNAFCQCYRLEEIRIPEGVTSIESDTFGSCTSLKEVRIPESVTSIHPFAFRNCYNLRKIILPDGFTYEIVKYGEGSAYPQILTSVEKERKELKIREDKIKALRLQLAEQEKIVDENKNKLFGDGAKRRKEAENQISQIQADLRNL